MPISVTITPGLGPRTCFAGLCVRSGRGPAGLLLMPQTHVCSHVPAFTRVDEPVGMAGWGSGNGGLHVRAAACGSVQGPCACTCPHAGAGPAARTAADSEGGGGSAAPFPGRRPGPGGRRRPGRSTGRGRAGALPVQPRGQLRRGGGPLRKALPGCSSDPVPPPPQAPSLTRRPLPPARSPRAAFQGQAPAWLSVPLRLSGLTLCFPESPGSRWACSPSSRCPQEQSGTPRWAGFAWGHTDGTWKGAAGPEEPAPSSGDS